MIQDLVLQLYLNGVWTSVPVYVAKTTRLTRGLDPGGAWPRPNRIETELANEDLALDPSRPQSPLYGIAGRNTRVRALMGASIRSVAEAASWRPQRTIDHVPGARRGRASVDLVAEGILGRISTWTEVLRSPMYRTISGRATSIGHWSMEDGREATVLSNSLAGGESGRFIGEVSLGDDESPLGAASSAKLGPGGWVSGRFRRASSTAGWQISWSQYLPSTQTATFQTVMAWGTTNGYSWAWLVNSTHYRLEIRDPDGVQLVGSNFPHTSRGPGQWITFRIKATASSGTLTYEPSWYGQGDLSAVGVTSTVAGTVGALNNWSAPVNPGTEGGWISHVFGVTTGADSLDGAVAQRIFNGYLGEPAAIRFGRLCAEAGITRYQIGNSADTQPMGPQRADTLLKLLREIVDTDDCLIYDEPSDVALTLRTRRDLLDRTPVLALTFGTNVAGYDKVLDRQGVANIVTASNRSGGDYTASLTSGPMSTQPTPAGIGEERTTVDVNVADEDSQLPALAGWHLAKGTLEEPRYASVTVDLLANPELETACQTARPGDLLTIAGIEPDLVRLKICGIVETVGAATRTFEFTTEPYAPYAAGRYDDVRFRYDVRSTLGTARTAGQTSWTAVAATITDVWSRTAVPYDVIAGGERVTVTAASAVTGTGPYTQTLTVIRAVNGVVKAQTAGTEIHIATPGRYAL